MHFLDRSQRDYRRDKKTTNLFDLDYNKQNVHHVSQIWSFVTVAVIAFIAYLTRYNYRENLPKALDNTDLIHHPNAFIAERAWKDLNIITNFGPRPTGAYSNEVLAVDFLKREISYIMQTANKNQHIEMDVQVVSGAYWANFKPHGMTNVYRNVQNVIVKLHGQNSGNNSLMLNCHFDSVSGSPGASDDAASCCVMLEILRVLSRQNNVNKHSIIFLFNGAEETPLQASHGFITQHKWAKKIKAFINLESVGSAGKEILFQSGPNHPWLIKMYGKAVPHPNAQAAAEEVFQSGLIPSDTDFRIFRDFGHIPGVDLAHVINGYRYHTKFDHIDYIPKSVLQHTGDNILELTKMIANSDELQETDKYSKGTEVFFDVLGFFFISYSKDFANIFNYIIVTLSIVLPYLFLSKVTKGINRKYIRYEIFLGFLINMICLVGSNVVCYAIAYELDKASKSMSWYSNTIFTVTTYCVSTLATQCLIHLLFNRNKQAPLSLALKVQARLNGTSLFWGLLTAAITLAGYRIGYVLMVPLLVTLITNSIVGLCGLQNSIQKWLYIHLIGQIFVVLWTTHYYHMLLEVFIPIAGRSAAYKNPDIMIAIICCSLTFFITSYLTPLIILLKQTSHFFVTLIVIYIFSRGYFIGLTNHGFPYRDESNGAPTVQRHFITHAIRTFYDWKGNIRYTDSGFWLRELDRNSKKTIESLSTPEVPIPQEENVLCKSEVFCGLPYHSCRSLHYGGYWIPAPSPLIREVASFKLIDKIQIGKNLYQFNFNLSGSYLISIQIRPKENIILQNWNIMDYVPQPNIFHNQKAYFVMITHGLEAPPMNVTLVLKSEKENYDGPLVDISLVTFHWEYHKEHTPAFANLLAKVPKWAFAVPSVAALRSWTF